ncbi:MAG: hypothetical protein OXU20_27525 [Myxococcales bacterium]|nr:hypothetical protein [Myxococcales bacterium]MDD9972004.1 hypothetical protein [Myxococcales bacterium]
MALPDRWLVVFPGGMLVAAFGLFVGYLNIILGIPEASVLAFAKYLMTVVIGPVYLVILRLNEGPLALSQTALGLAIAALVALPMHPIFGNDWGAALSVVGLTCWLLCELIVAGALG